MGQREASDFTTEHVGLRTSFPGQMVVHTLVTVLPVCSGKLRFPDAM